LFGNKWKEKHISKVEVDIPFNILFVILQYVYTRTYATTPESIKRNKTKIRKNKLINIDILDVVTAADRFLLSQLKYELELSVVKSYMDLENCIDLFLFASGIL